jgi:hypothetical protein
VRNVLPGLGNRVSTTMALAGFGWESAGSKPSHTLLCMTTIQFKLALRVVTDNGDLDGWSAAATQGERGLSSLIDRLIVEAEASFIHCSIDGSGERHCLIPSHALWH